MTMASKRGMTLIEVMGAVAIVGIWFLVLSASAMRGVAAEGNAQRLLEASMVADEVLADAETQALLGLPLEIETDEYGDLDLDGEPEFVVEVEIEPFDPLSRLTPANSALRGAPFVDPRSGSPEAESSPLSMQQLRIHVYLEPNFAADDELTEPLASRTTFLIDPDSLAQLQPATSSEPAPDLSEEQ